MKYLKKYNENMYQQDPEFAITKIKENFQTEVVEEMYSKEKVEWTPEDKDGVWYDEHNNGEAQDMVVNQMIGWFNKKYYSLSDENFEKVKQLILKEYEFLNFNY